MKTIRRTSILVAATMMVLALSFAQEQSDYEIAQSFKKQYAALTKAIEAAQTVQECAEISINIDALEKEYTPHKALLDKTLYPDDFQKKLEMVHGQLAYAQNKLGIIQESVSKIASLESQVKELSAQVEKLSNENGALMSEIQALRASNAQDKKMLDSLNTLVAKLQSSIRSRDKMIFAMVDSIFLQYDKNVDALKDVEKQKVASHIERNSVVGNIKKSVLDNVMFLQSTSLTGKDLATMAGEQKKFASEWKGLGPKLAAIYVSQKERAKEVSTIDTMITAWGAKVDAALWKSLNDLFTSHNLTVKPFNNGADFQTNVVGFIDDEIQNANQRTEAARLQVYTVFVDSVWNGELTTVWMPLMRDNDMVTEAQFGQVKVRIDAWRSTVQPTHTTLYIIIAVVVLLLLLLIYRRTKKSPKMPVT
jgi:outer membrane murein-binding lipoprotein Lpp